MKLLASSAISYQYSFEQKGFSHSLKILSDEDQLIHPDYAPFIPAMERRRMSEVMRTCITSALACIKEAHIEQPDGIIVGTAMGCPGHTKTFLEKIENLGDGLLSPTSFTLSTHNTIAGQLSLMLKCHGYNTTHTQGSLSFEHALLDAQLCLQEGLKHVLISGADEMESDLYYLQSRLEGSTNVPASGASSFLLAPAGTDSLMELDLISVQSLIGPLGDATQVALKSPKIKKADLVLYCTEMQVDEAEIRHIFSAVECIDYCKYSGYYATNSAFALALAHDLLLNPKDDGERIQNILIINNSFRENLGIIQVQKSP
jgi:hypothetical protein